MDSRTLRTGKRHFHFHCYLGKQMKKRHIDVYKPEEVCLYEFAIEYNDIKTFFNYYKPCDDIYNVDPTFKTLSDSVTEKGHAVTWVSETIPDFCIIEPRKEKSDSLCEDCIEKSDCEVMSYITEQRRYAITVSEKTVAVCRKCKKPVFNSIEPVELNIHDLRLLGYPVLFRVTRDSKRCPACNLITVDNPLEYLQSFCDSVMTPRLATATLRAYLSGVKRSEIIEAYGISNSQVNRIKKRMIELIRSRNASNALEAVMSHSPKIESISFLDSQKNEYYAFFYTDGSGEVLLADILTKEQYDCASLWLRCNAPDLNALFRDEADWVLAILVVSGSKKHYSSEDAISLVSEMALFITATHDVSDLEITQHVSTSDSLGRIRLYKLLNGIKSAGTNSNQNRNSDDASELPSVQNQYVLREFYDEENENLYSNDIVAGFIAQLSSALGKKRWQRNPRLLFDQLLYFNPAAISAIELYWFTGERYNGINLQALGSQCEARMPRRWGVPVRCLTYLMKNGLLKDQQHSLLPCYLVRHDYSASSLSPADENNLPCKMKNTYCVHCHDTI